MWGNKGYLYEPMKLASSEVNNSNESLQSSLLPAVDVDENRLVDLRWCSCGQCTNSNTSLSRHNFENFEVTEMQLQLSSFNLAMEFSVQHWLSTTDDINWHCSINEIIEESIYQITNR